jgi:hypothetical protein
MPYKRQPNGVHGIWIVLFFAALVLLMTGVPQRGCDAACEHTQNKEM